MNNPFSSLCKAAGAVLLASLAVQPTLRADLLWREDAAKPLIADKRANRVGDILTIIVQESSSATKDNNTKTSKASGVDASIASFLFGPTASSIRRFSGPRQRRAS